VTSLEGSAQLVEEEPPEDAREHADRQEEAGPADQPARCAETEQHLIPMHNVSSVEVVRAAITKRRTTPLTSC
jgi:hypothetical protein